MKNFKKILCAFLAIALLATSFAAVGISAEEAEAETAKEATTIFPDVSATAKYADAVVTLNKLSIINGYEDGTFGPDKNVTRAEFAALLLRMLGMDQTAAPLEAPFTDIATGFWAAGTIDAAKRLGIITGYPDGTFGPGNNVSYEEAITMIIRAIGYENYSGPGPFWYSSYLESARRLDITRNAVGAEGTPASRSCIAQLIYDTLPVNVRENDTIRSQTIMERHLGITKDEGIIASNSYTSLETPDVNLKENEVLIADVETGRTQTYRVQSLGEYDNAIGATITFYYRISATSAYDEIIMFSVKKATSKVTIDANLLDDSGCGDYNISFFKSESSSKASSLTLDANHVVIYNDKLYGSSPESSRFGDVLSNSKLPQVGSVSLLNRDSDNDYDVVFIEAYEHYAVSTVVSSTYTVTDRITSETRPPIVLDDTDHNNIISFVTSKGAKTSFSAIKKNSSIAVKESNDNGGTKMITVVILDNANGEVKSISSSGLTVGSKTYEYSSIAPWKNGGILTAPEKGANYTFFLDINGDIFAYIKNESAAASAKYGFIMGFRGGSGNVLEDDPPYLQILSQQGSKQWIPLYKNTKIDGKSIEGNYDNAYELLKLAAQKQGKKSGITNKAARQLVKYTLKTSKGVTVFDEIVTVSNDNDLTGGDAEEDELRMYGGFKSDVAATSDVDATYKSSGKVFEANGKSLYLGNAIVFVVPTNMEQSSGYKKGSASDFKNNNTYAIDAFDISGSKTAKVVVCYGGSSITAVTAKTAVFRVEDMYEEENKANDKNMLKVVGYENDSEETKEYWVSHSYRSRVEGLEKGDMVRFGMDSSGFVTLQDVDILYSAGTAPYYFAWEEEYGYDRPDEIEDYEEIDKAKRYATSDIKVILGTLYSVDEDYIIIAPNPDSDDIDDLTEVMRAEPNRFNSAKFYLYDTSGTPIEITKLDGTAMDILESYEDAGAKIFVHMQSGTVKTVLIIE